jgi:hypothetical protein
MWPGDSSNVSEVANKRDGLQCLTQALVVRFRERRGTDSCQASVQVSIKAQSSRTMAITIMSSNRIVEQTYHFICQDTIDAIVIKFDQPIQAFDLIVSHCAIDNCNNCIDA